MFFFLGLQGFSLAYKKLGVWIQAMTDELRMKNTWQQVQKS